MFEHCGSRENRYGAGGKRREDRHSALWGRGGKARLAVVGLTIALVYPAAGVAGGPNGAGAPGQSQALVPAGLLAAAQANPGQTFHVIVQGRRGSPSDAVGTDVAGENGRRHRSFRSISGVSADLTGKQILKLVKHQRVLAITPDQPTHSLGYVNSEMWRQSADVTPLWSQPALTCALDPLTGPQADPLCVPAPAVLAPQAPAIAVVDSGIDATKAADFGARVIASVDLSSLAPGATGDQQGHGTMVAGIAAGASSVYPGVAPNAPLVDVRTSDANGQSMTSDVIAACDWILAHKDQYGIRVVNISQAASALTSFRFDPIDQAVERLWLSGIVVVAAAGNYGHEDGSPVDVSHAPGNDPFVVTVGALDQSGTPAPADDTAAWWSAYGRTMDGFAKPELSAPGRYLIMPVPAGATIPSLVPDRIVAPGYMWMSGTSFSAPVVSGAAAQLLARHPGWTPDEVKGALMVAASALPAAGPAGGVGEVDAAAAAALQSPPNPNAGLDQFVSVDPGTGLPAFDQASWSAVASTNASWNEASWNEASWNEASWNEASWNEASWNEASWNEATLAP